MSITFIVQNWRWKVSVLWQRATPQAKEARKKRILKEIAIFNTNLILHFLLNLHRSLWSTGTVVRRKCKVLRRFCGAVLAFCLPWPQNERKRRIWCSNQVRDFNSGYSWVQVWLPWLPTLRRGSRDLLLHILVCLSLISEVNSAAVAVWKAVLY